MAMTKMEEQELRAFANALEAFETAIKNHCSVMESGIVGCQRFMQDPSSQSALRQAEQVCEDIRSCLNPTEALLEKVRMMIQLMDSAMEM